ncbi:MAG: hypothetical protein J7J96_05565 [Sulfurimonas sp.]|nr:hypothetical protein [Sulfurimonas sp.]
MKEPRLEDMDDYDTLKGEKKKVVIGVIIVGLILGAIYTFVFNTYDNKDEMIEVEKTLKNVPMR